jgi:hypothetical protein
MRPDGAIHLSSSVWRATKRDGMFAFRRLQQEQALSQGLTLRQYRRTEQDETRVVLIPGFVPETERIGTWNPGHRPVFYEGVLE